MKDKKEKKESYSKLSGIYYGYDELEDKKLIEFIEELKKDSETYEDVLNKLSEFERNSTWKESDKEKRIQFFINNIKRILYKEMNDLPLTFTVRRL